MLKPTRRILETTSLVIGFTLLACSASLPQPASTPKIGPPEAAAAAPTPQPPAGKCTYSQTLAGVKDRMPYAEFALNYNSIQGERYLSLWFVDPAIALEPGEAEVEQNALLAARHAAALAQGLNNQDPCIAELFTGLNPIVVDSAYNGWFSGNIAPSKLPHTAGEPTEDELAAMLVDFQVQYLRKQAPFTGERMPGPGCTWPQARTNLQRHFDPARENVSFMFIVDESGAHVDAQWDSDVGQWDPDTWWALQVASIMNVSMELGCLQPAPNKLRVVVVDSSGKILLVGALPEPNRSPDQLDLNDFQTIYRDTE